MKRPHLVHLTAIDTNDFLCIRASLTMAQQAEGILPSTPVTPAIVEVPSSPLKSIGLLSKAPFQMRIVALGEQQEELMNKIYETDTFGTLFIRVPKFYRRTARDEQRDVQSDVHKDGNGQIIEQIMEPLAAEGQWKELQREPEQVPVREREKQKQKDSGQFPIISRLEIFEIGTHPGLELLLGHFIPIQIRDPKRIVISDFDKTLVDTRYSTTKDMYNSLTRPIAFFPPVIASIELLKKYMQEGHQPFILTASPHFYERAIRDWLTQNKIYTAEIFSKDYRNIMSLFEGDLTPKDLKIQGFYKLNQLVNILLMTGIPDTLVLLGDGFESDTVIYLTLAVILLRKMDPWNLWNILKEQESFQLTQVQNSRFLNKMYQLHTMLLHKRFYEKDLTIFIRCGKNQTDVKIGVDALKRFRHLINIYHS